MRGPDLRTFAFALSMTLLAVRPGVAPAADADTPPPASTDFAFGMKFSAQGNAAAFRATLPPDVYRGVTSSELRDVAVFNGRGEVVPHVLAPATDSSDLVSAVLSLPVFPLKGNGRAVMEALRLTIESNGGKVDLALPEDRGSAAGGTNENGLVGGYIVDGRALTRLAAIELGWSDDAPEFAGRLRVEGSDNLGDWRTIVDAAPIANLRAGDARLIERRIEMRSAGAKYWRLTWVGSRAPFEITSVNGHPAGGGPELRRTSLVLEGRSVAGKPGEYEFDAGGYFPVDRVNLQLPEMNSVVEVSLLTRASASKPWRPVTDGTGFYRLQGTDAELVNGDVRVFATTDRYWLVRVDPRRGGMGEAVPKLKIAWPAHEIVFLARGQGPFTLAYGNGALSALAGRIASIPKGARILEASLGEQQTLGGESRRASASARSPSKSMVLWGVLGLGVALLAYMAYRLSRELRRSA
jgi:hypothetical protein